LHQESAGVRILKYLFKNYFTSFNFTTLVFIIRRKLPDDKGDEDPCDYGMVWNKYVGYCVREIIDCNKDLSQPLCPQHYEYYGINGMEKCKFKSPSESSTSFEQSPRPSAMGWGGIRACPRGHSRDSYGRCVAKTVVSKGDREYVYRY